MRNLAATARQFRHKAELTTTESGTDPAGNQGQSCDYAQDCPLRGAGSVPDSDETREKQDEKLLGVTELTLAPLEIFISPIMQGLFLTGLGIILFRWILDLTAMTVLLRAWIFL